MAYFGQNVIPRDLDLRATIDPIIQRHHVYVSTRLDERNTMVPKHAASFLSSKVIRKKLLPKIAILTNLWSLAPKPLT